MLTRQIVAPLILLALASEFHGADKPESPSLSVNEAIALSLAHNERAAIALEHLNQADGARREAWAEVLPKFNASGGYWRTRNTGNFNQGGVTLNVDLINPSSYPRLREALALYDVNQLDSNELRRALAFEVADGFALTLAAEQLVEAAVKRLEVNNEALRRARLNADAGLVARNEVTRTEVEQATAEGALVKARSSASRSRLGLGFLVGVPLDGRQLLEPTTPSGDPPAASILINEALRIRQDIQALTLRGHAATIAARTPRMDTLPKIGIQGSAGDGNPLGGTTGPVVNPQTDPSWSLGLVATWNLYDGGARYGRMVRLDSQAREVALTLSASQRRVQLDIATALEDLASARATLATAVVRAKAAVQNQDETHARFMSGLATAIEEADATASAFEAAAEQTRARFALWQSWLAINRTVGKWPTPQSNPQP